MIAQSHVNEMSCLARLGIATGSVSQYFDSKRALFTWLLSEAGRRKLQSISTSPSNPYDFFDRLGDMYVQGLEFIAREPRCARVVAQWPGLQKRDRPTCEAQKPGHNASMGLVLRRGLGRACITAILLMSGCASSTSGQAALPELSRYEGTWYEIASFPQRFQKGCTATTATYTARKDGKITVLNRCRKDGLDGKLSQAKGLARVVDTKTKAKLKVSFFRPFWGDYWIIDLDPE